MNNILENTRNSFCPQWDKISDVTFFERLCGMGQLFLYSNVIPFVHLFTFSNVSNLNLTLGLLKQKIMLIKKKVDALFGFSVQLIEGVNIWLVLFKSVWQKFQVIYVKKTVAVVKLKKK